MAREQLITLGLVGIGGYGGTYLSQIFENADELGVRLVGTVEPLPKRSPHVDQLAAADVPIYARLDEFYAHHTADMLIIASPIQHHMPQTRLALQHGSHVLCEKPLSATIQDGTETLAAAHAAERFVAIGYNSVVHRADSSTQSGYPGRKIWASHPPKKSGVVATLDSVLHPQPLGGAHPE